MMCYKLQSNILVFADEYHKSLGSIDNADEYITRPSL